MGIHNKTQIIIVSVDKKLIDYTFKNLSSLIETKCSLSSIVTLPSVLDRFTNNIILLDIDNQPVTAGYLKFLNERYHLTIVLLRGKSPFDFTTARDFNKILYKPDLSNIIQTETYIMSLSNIIKASKDTSPNNLFKVMNTTVNESQKIIAIASSTGGTKALEYIFSKLPENIIPILVVQHMPINFTKFFADSLNKLSPFSVVEAKQGDYLQMNTAYIAPAGKHMTLVKRNQKLSLDCFEGERIFGVIPAADILFNSIAPIMKDNVIGVILTGMGSDGARGLLEMRKKGAKTIGQDEKTCVVYGMPKVAYELNAVEKQLPLEKIPQAIIDLSTVRSQSPHA